MQKTYFIDQTSVRSKRTHDAIVAMPLMIITVFCFGFVMMHPTTKLHGTTASAAGKPAAKPIGPESQMAPLTVSSPPSQLLLAPVVTETPSVLNTAPSPASSPDASTNLQSALPNPPAPDTTGKSKAKSDNKHNLENFIRQLNQSRRH